MVWLWGLESMSNINQPEDAPSGIYGPDGRPHFFSDPAMDRFVPVVLNLASELWLQKEITRNLIALLARKGLATQDAIDSVARETANDPAHEQALRDFINRILGPLREAE